MKAHVISPRNAYLIGSHHPHPFTQRQPLRLAPRLDHPIPHLGLDPQAAARTPFLRAHARLRTHLELRRRQDVRRALRSHHRQQSQRVRPHRPRDYTAGIE